MGITIVRTLREALLKVASNLTSYKMWILATATWALSAGYISEWGWLALSVLVVSERAFEKFLGLGHWGRNPTTQSGGGGNAATT